MESRTLGSTGLHVSPIGLGLAALGRPGYINLGHAQDLRHDYAVPAMRAHAYEVLDLAWRLGIRYFDAARSYGRAEDFLGGWLQAHAVPITDVVVGSKWGYIYTANWQVEAQKHEIKEHSLAVFQQQWGETQTNLGIYLKLYQIHSATMESGVLDNSTVMAALLNLKRQGVCIGLSLSGEQQADTLQSAAKFMVDGRRLFDAVQVTWNLLEPSCGPVLDEVHTAGMGVIVKEALANGRLTSRNTDPAFAEKLDFLNIMAVKLDTTTDALALAAVLAQPWADVVLSGAATAEQLHSNVSALRVRLTDDVLCDLVALAEPAALYWATRARLTWN